MGYFVCERIARETVLASIKGLSQYSFRVSEDKMKVGSVSNPGLVDSESTIVVSLTWIIFQSILKPWEDF